MRFLLDGVPLPEDAASYERLVLMFDGEDDDPETFFAFTSFNQPTTI